MRRILLAFICLFPFNLSAELVKVGIVGGAPYIIRDNNNPSGLSIDLWNTVASNLQLNSQFQYFDTLDQALKQLQNHQVDLLVGPIPITPQIADTFAYTQSYHRIKLSAAVLEKSVSHWKRIMNVIGDKFFFYISALIILFFLVSFFMWFFEREKNSSQFQHVRHEGILEGVWFALSTVTTNGYADKTPISWQGRLLATIWIVVGTLIYSSVTASITTFLTLSTGVQENMLVANSLQNKKVMVPDSETAGLVTNNFHAFPYVFSSFDQAFSQLEEGKIHGIITGRGELRYYIQNHPESKAIILDTSVEGEPYAFLFNQYDSKYFRIVNKQIINAIDNGTLDSLKSKWIN